MRIKIETDGWGTLTGEMIIVCDSEEIGLRYIAIYIKKNFARVYDIIDEQLFFLKVVEHGITFEKLD
jgi:hypothetical protein